MKEWKKYKLGELITLKYGKDHKKLNDGSFPVYGSGGVMRYGNDYIYDDSSILIPRKGSLNNIMFVDKPFWTVDTMFWSIIDQELVLPRFLYYTLCKYDFAGLNVGSAVPSLTVPVIESIEVVIPSIEKQKRILSLLVPLDDKIALNQRINDNLEKSMSTLFDFYFGLDNSESNKYKGAFLTDIATFINGLAMQKFRPKEDEKGIPVLKIKELGQKSCDSSSDICSPSIKSDYIVNDGDVIFSWSGTLLVDIWSGGKCGLNQHLFKVTSSNYPLWFAYLWTRMHLNNFIRISKDKAVTMGHIKRVDLERAEISIPTDDTMQKLDKIFTPIFDSCVTIRVENRKLSQIRDSLLPKLMSGELKTGDLHR